LTLHKLVLERLLLLRLMLQSSLHIFSCCRSCRNSRITAHSSAAADHYMRLFWLPNRSADFGSGCHGQLLDICSLLILETKTISKRFVPSDEILHRTIDNNSIRESVENDRRAWSMCIVRECSL
jgi:hypothetical protein